MNIQIVKNFEEFNDIEKSNEGALPRQQTLDQLKKLRKLTKGIDISDRYNKMVGSNLQYETNPIDSDRIESYEEFTKKNQKFIPGWNTKGLLSPFKIDKQK